MPREHKRTLDTAGIRNETTVYCGTKEAPRDDINNWKRILSVATRGSHQMKSKFQRFCTTAMLHGRNNRFFFLWEKMFFLMQNIFIVPAMQHDCRAKPILHVREFFCSA